MVSSRHCGESLQALHGVAVSVPDVIVGLTPRRRRDLTYALLNTPQKKHRAHVKK